MVYLDTSILVKLYVKEKDSRKAAGWVTHRNQAIPLTSLHELEFTNAIELKQFRAEINSHDSKQIMDRFAGHEKMGVYFRPRLNWSRVFDLAGGLSTTHTRAMGARSWDILHVALALSIEADSFLTVDQRQAGLAQSAGLNIEKL